RRRWHGPWYRLDGRKVGPGVIRVSASALDILWSDLRLPGSPAPLAVRSVGETRDERARIRDEVYANLADRGLFRGGELDPALRERLELLAHASLVVECEALIDLSDPRSEEHTSELQSREK